MSVFVDKKFYLRSNLFPFLHQAKHIFWRITHDFFSSSLPFFEPLFHFSKRSACPHRYHCPQLFTLHFTSSLSIGFLRLCYGAQSLLKLKLDLSFTSSLTLSPSLSCFSLCKDWKISFCSLYTQTFSSSLLHGQPWVSNQQRHRPVCLGNGSCSKMITPPSPALLPSSTPLNVRIQGLGQGQGDSLRDQQIKSCWQLPVTLFETITKTQNSE